MVKRVGEVVVGFCYGGRAGRRGGEWVVGEEVVLVETGGNSTCRGGPNNPTVVGRRDSSVLA